MRDPGYLELVELLVIVLAIGMASLIIGIAIVGTAQGQVKYSVAITGEGGVNLEFEDVMRAEDSGCRMLYDAKAEVMNAQTLTMEKQIESDDLRLRALTNLSRAGAAPGRLLTGSFYLENIGIANAWGNTSNGTCEYIVSGVAGDAQGDFRAMTAMEAGETMLSHNYALAGEAGSAQSGWRTDAGAARSAITAGRYTLTGAVKWQIPATMPEVPNIETSISHLCVWQLPNGEAHPVFAPPQ